MTRRVDVLVVEDNPGDVRLIREGFAAGTLDVSLAVVEDGVSAMAYLRGEGRHARASTPDLILLDLGLPRRDGHEILTELKSDPRLRRIPVCVLSASTDEADVTAAYDGHANAYVPKPMELDRFMEAIRQVERFWFAVAALPSAVR